MTSDKKSLLLSAGIIGVTCLLAFRADNRERYKLANWDVMMVNIADDLQIIKARLGLMVESDEPEDTPVDFVPVPDRWKTDTEDDETEWSGA